MSLVAQNYQSIFGTPARWVVRLLAWLAFFITAYLAWKAVTGSSVAGCGVGTATGCDLVLSSKWSKWLGLPVAMGGLTCYASLAATSVLLGLQNPQIGRWIDTLAVMLCLIAAGASVWFIGIQLFVIGHLCPYCMVVDVCGIVLGAVAAWSLFASRDARAADNGLMALRSVTIPRVGAPLNSPGSRVRVGRSQHSRPLTGLALGGACALLLVLIGGQIVAPSKTHEMHATALDKPIDLISSSGTPSEEGATVGSATEHIAMRVPADPAIDDDATDLSGVAESDPPERESADSLANDAADEPAPKRERLVTFLGGKLTLNVYDHPVLGDPEAPHVMVEMVSYNCAHCRKMHRIVKKGMKRYGDQLAVIIVLMPMEMKCNRLITDPKASHAGACATARMALGVAAIEPSDFASFHDWLMADEEKPPDDKKVVAKAYGMVAPARLREVADGDELNKKIAQYIDLFATLRQQQAGNKNFGMPIQILGDEVMTGMADDPEDVFRAWEKNLGMKPR